jgi:hypothetical protein
MMKGTAISEEETKDEKQHTLDSDRNCSRNAERRLRGGYG